MLVRGAFIGCESNKGSDNVRYFFLIFFGTADHKKEKHLKFQVLFGADDEARTRYLHLGKVALYQMSYIRMLVPPVGIEPTTRGFSVHCSTN